MASYGKEISVGSYRLRRIRTMTSHAASARFYAEVGEPLGWIPRLVRQPYSFGPTHAVWSLAGKPVVCFEPSHRRYEAYEVVEGKVYATDDGALDAPRSEAKEPGL